MWEALPFQKGLLFRLSAALFNNAGPGATNLYLRFDSWNFNTGAYQTFLGWSGPTTVAVETSQWYRMEFTMERETADPTKVDLDLYVYGILGGVKGGGTGSLLGSYSLNGIAALGDFVQFGMRSGATYLYQVNTDNFNAIVGIPEPSVGALLLAGAALIRRRRTKR